MTPRAATLPLDAESRLVLVEDWLDPGEAEALFTALRQEIAWRQESIRLFGRTIPQPRLIAWYGDPGAVYTYSGLTVHPIAFPPRLDDLRRRAGATASTLLDEPCAFNSALANLYRDGNDSMGLHADDEPELGPAPVIASLSLGATRRFVVRPRRGREGARTLDLRAGTLLLMAGAIQRRYRHGVPRQPAIAGARINLTFRRIVEVGGAGAGAYSSRQ